MPKINEIGSYTWEKDTAVYDDELLEYFHKCINGLLYKPKWWKQEHTIKKIKVIIEVID